MSTTQRLKYGILLIALAGLGGCATRPDPDYLPVPPEAMTPSPPSNGAIYQAGYSIALFEDLKARRVGDVLTITLVEATSASKKSDTSTSKESELNLGNPTLLGSPVQFDIAGGLLGGSPLQNRTGNTLGMGYTGSQEFGGKGNSIQSNSLKGNISVTVAQVLPNGNLVVRGEKLMVLHNGEEYVRLRGIVRPVDITVDNTVPSTRVAHAQITYGGKGALVDASNHGWLDRFFLKWWPF